MFQILHNSNYSHLGSQFLCKSVPSIPMFDNLQYRVHSPPTTNVMVSPSVIRFPVRQREIGEQLWTVTLHW